MYILIPIAAIIIFYPCIRILIKNALAWKKIKKFCLAHRFSYQKNHSLVFWGRNQSARCDCYIETPQTIYAIKFFSVRSKIATLIFTSDKKYYIRKRYAYLALTIKSREKPFVNYDFKSGCPDTNNLKHITPVLLIHPACTAIKTAVGVEEKTLIDGESVSGIDFYTLPSFLKQILHDNEK